MSILVWHAQKQAALTSCILPTTYGGTEKMLGTSNAPVQSGSEQSTNFEAILLNKCH